MGGSLSHGGGGGGTDDAAADRWIVNVQREGVGSFRAGSEASGMRTLVCSCSNHGTTKLRQVDADEPSVQDPVCGDGCVQGSQSDDTRSMACTS